MNKAPTLLSPAAGSTVQRYVSLNTHSRLTYFLERSGHIGHGYESPEARRDGMPLVPPKDGFISVPYEPKDVGYMK